MVRGLEAFAALAVAEQRPDQAVLLAAAAAALRQAAHLPPQSGTLTERCLAAARHIANILLKLGFGSRAQVAAWAARAEDRSRPPGP
jgi:hypothetical protein